MRVEFKRVGEGEYEISLVYRSTSTTIWLTSVCKGEKGTSVCRPGLQQNSFCC